MGGFYNRGLNNTNQMDETTNWRRRMEERGAELREVEKQRSFDRFGTVATPAVGASATVLTEIVPLGYDGVLERISHNVSGSALIQGSGDLIWRIRIDGRFLQDYGNMLVEFGSPQWPRPISGIYVKSGQRLEYVVENINFILVVSYITCCFAGYYWPQRMPVSC